MRKVMMKGTWPEDNFTDVEVTDVRPGESDEDAVARAQEAYGEDQEYYIEDTANDIRR